MCFKYGHALQLQKYFKYTNMLQIQKDAAETEMLQKQMGVVWDRIKLREM